jgi:predicted porin
MHKGISMKLKIAATMAILTAVDSTTAVHAQSSVTLYGLIDAGISYTNNAAISANRNGRQLAFTSSALDGNKWGIRAKEDLGGGLSAIVALDSGFNSGTGKLGQGGRLFGKLATVGFSDTTWGTITLGRQYDPLKDLLQPLTADRIWGTVNVTPGDLDNYDDTLRVNNSVKYVSPDWHNLKIDVLYAFGGSAGNFTAGQTSSVAVSYKYAGFSIGGGYFLAKYVPGGVSTSDTSNISLANSGYAAAASSLQIARAAAAYELDRITVGVGYSNSRYKPASTTATAFTQTEAFNSFSAFTDYRFTPALFGGLSYSYTNSNGAQSAHYNQFAIGAQYLLSKRTALYAEVGYQRSAGQTLNGSLAVPATASIGDSGYQSASMSQLQTYVGIAHRF